MRDIFLMVLNRSLTAGYIIAVVLLARLALRKAPRVFSYALWAVVLLRLLCPVSIPSPVSLVPSAQPIPLETVESPKLYIDSGISAIDEPVNDYLGDHYFEGVALAPTNFKADLLTGASAVWLAGAAALLGYGLISLLLLRRRLVGSIPLEGERGVRLADHIPSPFVLGLVRPVVYLPSGLAEGERDYILLHERTHVRRCDHITRALAWLALSVHWFNPLVWLAFHLAGRDMEMSCDEAVLRKMGRDVRADYSTSLLRLSTGKRLPVGPLAFGGGDPESRIKNVLSWKKPALWVPVLALIGVLCAGAALATDPAGLIDPDTVSTTSSVWISVRAFRNTEYVSPTVGRDDLFDPDSPYSRALPQENGLELVRLINAYHRSVFPQGDPEGTGLDDWMRICCLDGGYYLVHYYYWNGFCFNPLHPGHGEDDYVTLVTHYDAQGNAGTTWRMECEFDDAFLQWRGEAARALEQEAKEANASDEPALFFRVEQSESGNLFVRISGQVCGHTLKRSAVWWPEGMEALFDGHSGGLSMSYQFESGGAELSAWWADEEHTAVTISTRTSAMLSSYGAAGWWEFTVDLSTGAVTQMTSYPVREDDTGAETHMYPASITDEEAVQVVQIAARLLAGAESHYSHPPAFGPSAQPQ